MPVRKTPPHVQGQAFRDRNFRTPRRFHLATGACCKAGKARAPFRDVFPCRQIRLDTNEAARHLSGRWLPAAAAFPDRREKYALATEAPRQNRRENPPPAQDYV